MRTETYSIGVRTLSPDPALETQKKDGDYYVFDLKGPEEVPALIGRLASSGVLIREVREMQNPLEELFK
jgi:hypothetical protein